MKVLHIISSLDARSGGTSEACAGVALAQATAGLEVWVLASQRADEVPEVADRLCKELGVGRVAQIGPARGPLARHPELPGAVDKAIAGADLVHLHGVWEEIQFLAAREAVRQAKPYVWAPHGMLDPWSLSQGRMKKRLYWWWRWRKLAGRAAAIHYITRSEARLARPMFPEGMQEIIEPLGTDRAAEARDSAPSAPRQLLFLSRLHPKKNLECLLEAFSLLKDRTCSLQIAGSGDDGYRAGLEALADKLGVVDRVQFTGDLRGAAKQEAFRSAALFCLPSHQENFGIVVIEALATGLPVMLSPAVGLAEDLEELEQVKIVRADVEAWARGIEEILADRGLLERAARSGPEFVRQRFSWDVIGRNWVAHYGRLLKKG